MKRARNKNLGRVTEIVVEGERWRVPRGFGEAYKLAARSGGPHWEILRDLLELVGYTATECEIKSWSLLRRVEAELLGDPRNQPWQYSEDIAKKSAIDEVELGELINAMGDEMGIEVAEAATLAEITISVLYARYEETRKRESS